MSRPPEPYGEPLPPRQLTGIDALFANTNIVIVVLFGFCCGTIALVMGIVGLIACKDPKAKQNALIVTAISGIMHVLGVIASLTGQFHT